MVALLTFWSPACVSTATRWAEIDDEISIARRQSADAVDLRSKRAANLDDVVVPFGVAHRLPISLQERGLLQFAGRDLIAPLVDEPLKPLFRLGDTLDLFLKACFDQPDMTFGLGDSRC